MTIFSQDSIGSTVAAAASAVAQAGMVVVVLGPAFTLVPAEPAQGVPFEVSISDDGFVVASTTAYSLQDMVTGAMIHRTDVISEVRAVPRAVASAVA
jgi:hypothetical protein